MAAVHITELLRKHNVSDNPSHKLVSSILAETGGIARLVMCAIALLKHTPQATELDPDRFLDFIGRQTPKDLRPHGARDDMVVAALLEWALLGLPVHWQSSIKDAVLVPSHIHEMIAAAGLQRVHELVHWYGLHTTPHEDFAESKVRYNGKDC